MRALILSLFSLSIFAGNPQSYLEQAIGENLRGFFITKKDKKNFPITKFEVQMNNGMSDGFNNFVNSAGLWAESIKPKMDRTTSTASVKITDKSGNTHNVSCTFYIYNQCGHLSISPGSCQSDDGSIIADTRSERATYNYVFDRDAFNSEQCGNKRVSDGWKRDVKGTKTSGDEVKNSSSSSSSKR